MKKITKRSQFILYAFAGMGVNMLNLMMNSYLCSALLIGGFGEDAIPFQTFLGKDLIIPAVWAVFALVAKIVDGIIDIPMASATDNLRTRWGRRRPAIVLGFIPMAVAYLLFLVVPNPSGITLLNTLYYGFLLCVFYIGYTLTMVTYYSTYSEIVETAKERTSISNAKAVFDIVYFILGYVVVRMLLNNLNIRPVALIVFPISFTMLIALLMIKEESTKDGVKGEITKPVNLAQSFVFTFKNKPFVIWMIVYAMMTLGVQLFLGGINEYFSFVGMNMMFIMVAAFAPVPFTLLLFNKIMKDKGFGTAYKFSLFVFSAGMIILFLVGFLYSKGILAPDSALMTIIPIFAGIVCSFGVGAIFSVAYFIPAELAAEEEKRTGIAGSAMYFAIQGLFSGVASGIATGVILTALKQTDGAMTFMTLIAGVATLVAAIMVVFLPQSIKDIGRGK